jgi:DNA replication ATP-dependent helicase Dna2
MLLNLLLRTKVIFINTDTIPHSQESSTAETIQNSTECKIVCQILANLLSHGASSKQIGILSFYNSQLQIIKSEIPEFCNDLELLTIDKSQGRDKECIIVSFVRSNTEGNGGNLLQDWRRINVLLTRAKRKLVLVGSKSTLRNVPILDQLLSLLQDQSQICECIEGQG